MRKIVTSIELDKRPIIKNINKNLVDNFFGFDVIKRSMIKFFNHPERFSIHNFLAFPIEDCLNLNDTI